MVAIDSDKTKNVRGNRATELLKHISSLFTKEEVIAMLTDLKLEIEESPITDDGIRIEDYSIYERGYEQATLDYSKMIQQKIDKLRGTDNEVSI